MRLRVVVRRTMNRPNPFFPLMCLKPRKSNVSGLPSPLGGMLFYSVGLLASTLFAGDFTSAGIGIAVVFAVNNSTRVIESLKRLNLQDAITPMYMIDRSTFLIRGQMPWSGIAFSFALSLVLSAWAWRVTIARDF